MHPDWLSNAYLVADQRGGSAVFVDSGAPLEPLLLSVEAHELTVTHLLVTHGHGDHTAGIGELQSRFGLDPVQGAGLPFRSGELEIEALETPGHSADSLSFLISTVLGEAVCFTGDTLFRGSVGGSGTSVEQLRRSIMDVILALPAETRILPGHSGETSVGEEWELNPFVRIWRGLDPEGQDRCTVDGQEAQLVLWAGDYDGGHKAWVRYQGDLDQILGGSRVSLRA